VTDTNQPLACLKCSAVTKRLDSDPETMAQRIGWQLEMRRILTECPVCKTGPRLRRVFTVHLDEGDFSKRSLR